MYKPLTTMPLLFLAASAFAQKQATTEKDSLQQKHLGEVVVSANRRPVTLDHVPSSVTILSKKTLDNNMAVTTDVTDILAREVPGMAPGAQTNSNVGQGLRGRSVLVMIDGIPQSSPLRNGEVDLRSIDPAVLERVEVLKGATAIYGNGATGGLINYITANPTGDKPLSGKTSVNMTGGLVGLKNSVGGRFGQMLQGKSGKWEYMASGVYEQTGEYKDANGELVGPNYSLGETETWNGYAKAGYHINSRQKLQLMYNFFRSQQNSNYTLVNGDIAKGIPATGVLGKTAGTPTGSKGNHNVHLVYQADSLIGATSLTADAYFESRDDIFYVSFGRFEGGDGQSHTLDKKKGLRLMLNSPLLNRGSFSGNISYGADLLNDITSQPLVDGRVWVPEMNMLNYAPFAETQFTFWDNIILKAGVRVENVGVKVKDYTTLQLTSGGTVVSPAIAVKGGDLNYTAKLFNAGIRYNRLPLFMPYFSFSQGFSVSDVGLALRDSKVNDIRKINTEAVLVNNYELGFVTEHKGLRFELSSFVSTSKLGADMIFDPNTGLFNVSRTPERIYGFEAAVSYSVLKNLDLSATYSYLEGKADTAKTGGSYNVYLNGRRIAPPKITGTVAYRPLKDLEVRIQYLGVQGRDRFAKNAKGVYNGNEGAVKAYNLFNFAASYKLNPKTMFTLGVENLFNEDYFPARSQWFMQPGFYAKGRGASFNLGIAITY
ncbi:iron complex outermembrane recepter protein [Chitinophaga jiangningensis]|uniref:Iron complex outermembrane recepter protein n=1 Tax=Chitinophaga jiangningensis TaxID=1419482 RepID=A0A1M6V1I7_9BACT|nr:TonB-dependent receptor [Chitinophaga jiangningensis]SHK75377.1 iron complex outermembrane recepter protein [Chitinophaga jiangningensis]